MPTAFFRGVTRKIFNKQRAGADQGHITYQDIPKLGQLVQAGGTKEAAVFIEALIVGKKPAVLVLGVGHGAEFDKLKDALLARLFADFTRAKLGEEGVTAHSDSTCYHKYDKDW